MSSAKTRPRVHEVVQTYHCWRCRTSSYARRTFTIVFLDGQPTRVYEFLFFAGAPRCPRCGETTEFVRQTDEAALSAWCARRCATAATGKSRCQCQACFGASHAVGDR